MPAAEIEDGNISTMMLASTAARKKLMANPPASFALTTAIRETDGVSPVPDAESVAKP
jgi:hypothetical protein